MVGCGLRKIPGKGGVNCFSGLKRNLWWRMMVNFEFLIFNNRYFFIVIIIDDNFETAKFKRGNQLLHITCNIFSTTQQKYSVYFSCLQFFKNTFSFLVFWFCFFLFLVLYGLFMPIKYGQLNRDFNLSWLPLGKCMPIRTRRLQTD